MRCEKVTRMWHFLHVTSMNCLNKVTPMTYYIHANMWDRGTGHHNVALFAVWWCYMHILMLFVGLCYNACYIQDMKLKLNKIK